MKLFYFKITLLVACLMLAGVVFVAAEDDPFSKLTYPIPELGNCSNRDACKAFCDKSENMESCLDFAEVHDLLPAEEIEMGRRMLALGLTSGPGGCQGQTACEAYCDEIGHIRECIAFAEENNLIPAEELEEAKKVIRAMDQGFVPPNCKGKKECDIYCSKPENMEECIAFGEAAGLIPPDETADAKKMLEAMKKGVKPPACSGKKECDVYCSQVEHMEECMTFSIAAGFMPAEEIENAKKTLKALKQGVRPPNCQGQEECDVYCSQVEHMAECMEFGIAAGFISPEEIEGARGALRAIKQGIKPPNCQGEEECNTYCSQPEHIEECMEFSIAAGFMPPEEIENAKKTLEAIKKGIMPPNCQGEEECQAFCQDPANIENCLNFSVEMGHMTQEEADRALRRMRGLAEGGPGGCKTDEECNAICQNPADPSLAEECINFHVKLGDISPEEGQQMIENMKKVQEAPPQEMNQYQPPQEGGGLVPCEGPDCPQMPLPSSLIENPPEQFAPGTEGNMPQSEGMESIQPMEGGETQPQTPSTAPGAGGELTPGESVPLAPPAEQQPLNYDLQRLFNATISIFKEFLFKAGK